MASSQSLAICLGWVSKACWHPWAASVEPSDVSCQSGIHSLLGSLLGQRSDCRMRQILKLVILYWKFTATFNYMNIIKYIYINFWFIYNIHTKTFALICGPVNKDFAAYNVSEWQEHLHQLSISKLLWQVVNEEVASFRSRYRATW